MNLPDEYYVDFGEVSFPMSPQEERAWLDWKIANGVMTQRELLLYFNPDMSEEEINIKLGEVQLEREALQPQQPTFGGLRNLGTVG